MSPSRLAYWILACAIPADDREAVVGDLVEEYAIRLAEGSRRRAWCWYWSQVIWGVPWLLWMPVRRSGLFGTLAVAIVACLAQAGVEFFAASTIRTLAAPDVPTSLSIGLAAVLLSLFVVSYVAARLRPGAGVLLTVIAMVAVLAQSFAMGPSALALSHVAAAIAAPSAAFAGSALSTARAG